jgi:preprotein translocase subunit SecG
MNTQKAILNRSRTANKTAGRVSTFLVILLFGFVLALAITSNKSAGRMFVYKIEQKFTRKATN